MDIRSAILDRTADKPFITRQSWVDQMAGAIALHKVPKILPTDSVDCCVLTAFSERNPCRGWQPTAGDLVAEDWITAS